MERVKAIQSHAETLLKSDLSASHRYDVQQIVECARDLAAVYAAMPDVSQPAVRGSFIQRLHHPLFTIMACARLLLREDGVSLSREQAIRVKAIWNAARQLEHALVKGQKPVSLSTGERVVLNLGYYDLGLIIRDVLQSARELIAHKPVEYLVDIFAHLPPVYVDGERLYQIIYNLVENAARYTDLGYILVRADAVGDVVEVVVADTGLGIPEEYHPLIFDLSLRETHPNTPIKGIWLALSKEFLEHQGGSIHLKSEPLVGATFTLILPTTPVTEPSVAPR